jgi:hypothetical protein
MHKITLKELERDLEILRKKIFIYETLQSEKEIREKKIKGPFKKVKEVIKILKENV